MNKKNLVLGGVLAVLILVAFLYQGPLKTWRENFGKPDNFLKELSLDQVTRIELEKPGEVIAFVKVDSKWKIDGTKDFWLSDAQAALIENSQNEVKKATLELVSENPGKKADFQTDESGLKLKLMNGNEIMNEYIIGKVASDFQSTYISDVDSEKTYLVKVALNAAFNQGEWFDRTIFSVESDKITKVRFQYPDRNFTMEIVGEGDDAQWKGTEPYVFSVKKEKIEEILNIMSSLSAEEIPEQTFDGTGLENHSIIVQATGDGVDNTIMIGNAKKLAVVEGVEETEGEEELYFVKKGDSDNIYLITKEERDELDKWIWQLR